MDCRGYRANIQPFIKDELDAKGTIRLIKHVSNCNECREELKIQFLVFEGLKRLESGRSFDLNRDFEQKIKSSWKYSKTMESIQRVIVFAKFAGLLIAIFYLLMGLIM